MSLFYQRLNRALIEVVKGRNKGKAKKMIEAGADVLFKDEDGNTALMEAHKTGDKELISILEESLNKS